MDSDCKLPLEAIANIMQLQFQFQQVFSENAVKIRIGQKLQKWQRFYYFYFHLFLVSFFKNFIFLIVYCNI